MFLTKRQSAISAVLISGLLTSASAQAAPSDSVVLSNSFKPSTENVRVLGIADPTALVEFDVALKMRNYDDLRARIDRREVVSNTQMESDYLPLRADHATLIKWLQTNGLSIKQAYENRLSVRVIGTVAQAQAALAVEFAKVSVNSQEYLAAKSAPSIPQFLTQFVLGINGLQPYQSAHPLNITQPQPQSPSSAFSTPYSVNDLKTAYQATNLPTTGAGQRIAILIDTFPLDSDLTTFWAANNVSQNLSNIEKVQAVGGTLPAVSGEESLDAQWSSGIAPGAKIRIYASQSLAFTNLDTTFQRIISDLNAGTAINALSISLGACESALPASQIATDDQFLATIASKGVSILVASGDQGSNCPNGTGVDFFASVPNVTAVGGTSLTLNGAGTVVGETGWSGSGGGNSTRFARPNWQVGSGVPSGTTRLVPDVALNADPNTGFYIVLNGAAQQIGGTSASAPAWAGFTALINEGRVAAGKENLGFLNPILYPLLATNNFRDITVGSNGDYRAAAGYDRVTGIGVPVVGTLYNTLVGSTPPPPSQPNQLLGNPGFENGSGSPAPWVASAGVINNAASPPSRTGSWKAWLDGYGSTRTDTLYQSVTIPASATSATLDFYLYISTAETTTATAYDILKVQVRNNAGNILATLATYSNLDKTNGAYVLKSFNLSAYKGQTVQIYLVGTEDSSLQTSFVVDDFALNNQ